MNPEALAAAPQACRSTLAEMAGESSFHRLLWDDAEVIKDGPIKLQKDAKIRRVVICTGKVYYDLLEEREKRGIDDIYLLRIEQSIRSRPRRCYLNELSRFRSRRDGLVSGRTEEHGCMVHFAPCRNGFSPISMRSISAFATRDARHFAGNGPRPNICRSSPHSLRTRWAANKKRERDGIFLHETCAPPRPTFPHDGDGEEMAAMKRHAEYWHQNALMGSAIAVGPVFEGEGAFGIAVADQAAAQALADADPITSGFGFRFDVLPMLSHSPAAGRVRRLTR